MQEFWIKTKLNIIKQINKTHKQSFDISKD